MWSKITPFLRIAISWKSLTFLHVHVFRNYYIYLLCSEKTPHFTLKKKLFILIPISSLKKIAHSVSGKCHILANNWKRIAYGSILMAIL